MPAPDYATEIAALRAGLGSSELTIESNGERLTMKSAAQILAQLSYFENLAANPPPSPGAPRRSSFGFSAVAFDRE